MKYLAILVPQGQSNLSSIVGAYKVFSVANEYFARSGRQAVFTIQLVGASRDVDLYDGLFSVHPGQHYDEVKKADLVIIPALRENYATSIVQNQALCTWVVQQYKQGAAVASICTGAFLLAATGLLKGRQCSTHWKAAHVFRNLFPDVELVPDQLITDAQGIYTNGGGFSFLNLMLYLVEIYYDRETAIYCSKIFQIDIGRHTQSPFIIFSGQKTHDDEVIRSAQLYIENNIGHKITVDSLAGAFALSRRNFDRRFKKATGNSPVEYLQRAKIEAAKKSLENGRNSIHEVMYSVGYSDRKAFRMVFKKITGLSPLDYRNRYNKEAAVAGYPMPAF